MIHLAENICYGNHKITKVDKTHHGDIIWVLIIISEFWLFFIEVRNMRKKHSLISAIKVSKTQIIFSWWALSTSIPDRDQWFTVKFSSFDKKKGRCYPKAYLHIYISLTMFSHFQKKGGQDFTTPLTRNSIFWLADIFKLIHSR